MDKVKDTYASAYQETHSYTFLTGSGFLVNKGNLQIPFMDGKKELLCKEGSILGLKVILEKEGKGKLYFCVGGEWKKAFDNIPSPLFPIVSVGSGYKVSIVPYALPPFKI